MNMIWGIILLLVSAIAYVGQAISAFWPETAARWGLADTKDDVAPAFYADARGEAVWDTVTLWTLPVAAVLLMLNNPAWVYFGLVGGGMYLYFAGRGILARRKMQQENIRIGSPETVNVAFTFLAIWGIVAVVTIVLAISALPIS